MALIDELQSAVDHLASTVGPSIVRLGRGWGRGAGVVIADGKVLTNAHNLRGGEVTVTFPDGHSEVGSVTGVDADGDLAVVNVATGATPAIAWDPAAVSVRLGTPVFAVANPAGRGLRVTFGLVSAVGQDFEGPRGRRIAGSIEHTAPLNRGSSGGPIVDAAGHLLGINTNRVGDGFYLALPADADLKSRVDALSRGESPVRPRLGIAIVPAHAAHRLRAAVGLPERDGLLIRGVAEGGPAGRAGLRQGDLLVAVDGNALASQNDLHAVLDAVGADGSLTFTVVRGAEEVAVTVSFAEVAAES